MAIDFPAAPNLGDTFVAGVFTYTWDGTQWVGKFTGSTIVLIKKTATPNNPPADNSLAPGELAVELGGPYRLWVGVPTSIIPTGKKLLLDTATAIDKYVDIAGDTMTGFLVLNADPTNPLHAATKQYVDAIAVGAANSVRYDVPQVLTEAQMRQARQNIYAAPFDAMAFNGMQFNGSMDVSLEYVGALQVMTTSVSRYPVEGWQTSFSGPAGCQMRCQQLPPPSNFPNFSSKAFPNTIQFWAGTPALTPLAGNHYALMMHYFEGNRMQRLGFGGVNAAPVTFAFWIYATVPGTACFNLRNGAADRCYNAPFTVNAANTWEYKVITVPGDTIGNWTVSNSVGMVVSIATACGATFAAGAPNVWQTSNFFGTPAITNFHAVAGNAVAITGFTALPGLSAPSADRSPYIQRPYDQEVDIAQRYYEKSYSEAGSSGIPPAVTSQSAEFVFIGSGLANGTPQIGQGVRFKTQKRVAPTMTIRSPGTGNAGFLLDGVTSGDLAATVDNVGTSGCRVYSTATAASTGALRYMHWIADARMG